MKIPIIFSIGWRFLLLILALVIGIGIYWCYHPLSINLQIVPYGTVRIKYKLFDDRVIADKFIINKQQIYISPIAIPLTKDRIPRIYIGDNNGYLVIKNLRPLAIKNNYIEIEAKNFDLYKILKKAELRNVKVTTKATFILLDNIKFELGVKYLFVTNTPIGDIKTQFSCYKNNLDMILELPKYSHKLKCFGTIDLNKPMKWDLKLISQSNANIKRLKIKDVDCNADIKYDLNWRHGFKDEKLLLKLEASDTSVNSTYTKNIDLGNIKLDVLYCKNNIGSTLELSKFKHTVSCSGSLWTNGFDLDIKPRSQINIKNLNFMNNFIANGIIKYNIHAKRHNKHNIFTGDVNVTNCYVRNIKNNILVKNIIGTIKLNNNLLLLEKLEAELFNFIKCKIYADGTLNIDNFNIDARVQLQNGELRNIPYAKSNISADVKIDGNMNVPLNANGAINLTNAVADITPLISQSITATEMTKNIIDKTTTNQKKLSDITLPINTNIKLTITPHITINGSGLTSTWKGGGVFKSEVGKPIMWGIKLNAINGKYELLKKKIKLYSGEILSNPNLPNYYKLSLTARKKLDNKDFVGIKFIQYNDDTNIDFFSNTMRSKQNILSLFLFDKESSELTVSEAYSLGMLVQNVSTGNGNIFEKMNKLLKIDTIEFKRKEGKSGDYNTVAVGKNIGKWKLNFEQGKNIDETAISVNRSFKKHAKVGVSLSKGNGLEGGISWNKRY